MWVGRLRLWLRRARLPRTAPARARLASYFECYMKTAGDLRRLATARSLSPSTTLDRAIERMAFVQADPIRSPARAQDLTLRPRVQVYRAGDLDAKYGSMPIEEDFFINYGFVTR